MLSPNYGKVLEHHGVVHVYNHWSYMPSLAEQHQRMEQRFTAPLHGVATSNAAQNFDEAEKNRAEPYAKIVEELQEMRRDTVELVRKAVEEKRKAYVIVNNRSEGMRP